MVYLAIVGVGGVGSAFLDQISKKNGVYVVAIVRSSTSVFALDEHKPISLSHWREELDKSGSKLKASPNDLLDYLTGGSKLPNHTFKGPLKEVILVDNTSSQEWAESYPLFLANGISIVTPNKKPFSGSQDLWDRISSHTQRNIPAVYHESSVGAGLPIISTLKDLVETGDKIKRIEGIVSGSLSFLFNNFMPLSSSSSENTASTPWSTHVKKARELGYTEPDPRDDLSGLDVARKIVILARVAGLTVEKGTDSFPIESLITKELENVKSGNEFLERLHEFDGQMEDMKRGAREKGKVVRYVGSVDVEKKELKVGMQWLDAESPLAELKGSDNVFGFWTERYGENPLVVRGAGAGAEVTAMGVFADLNKVVQRMT